MKYATDQIRREPVLRTVRYLAVLVVSMLGLSLEGSPTRAQGCIVARSASQIVGPESQGGYLAAGHWELTIDYRHQFSFRHFVGPTEQGYRIQQGSQVENKINLENVQLTYQATPRWSFGINLPLLTASRRANNSYYTLYAQGIGDTILTAQSWLWNPGKAHKGNVSVGFGVLIPTGKDNIKNTVIAAPGQPPQDKVVDYSIQPGSGGWGLAFQWQAFKGIGKQTVAYFNGSYIAALESTNGVVRNPANRDPLTGFTAVSDQYLLEPGIAYSISSERVPGLALTFGPRIEGVPAYNLLTKNDRGFRRPGFAISVEPGVQYAHGRTLLTVSVGKAIYRDRTKSMPDHVTGGHGDAAFADYVWLASISHRF
jgi:hypothetical protein